MPHQPCQRRQVLLRRGVVRLNLEEVTDRDREDPCAELSRQAVGASHRPGVEPVRAHRIDLLRCDVGPEPGAQQVDRGDPTRVVHVQELLLLDHLPSTRPMQPDAIAHRRPIGDRVHEHAPHLELARVAEPPEEHVDRLLGAPGLPRPPGDQMTEPDRGCEHRRGTVTVVRQDGLDESPGRCERIGTTLGRGDGLGTSVRDACLAPHRCLLVQVRSRGTLGTAARQNIRNRPYGSAGPKGSRRPCCNAKSVAVERDTAPVFE